MKLVGCNVNNNDSPSSRSAVNVYRMRRKVHDMGLIFTLCSKCLQWQIDWTIFNL